MTDSVRLTRRSLPAYPAYKDTGIPWLGRIPAHWEIRRVKTLFNYRKELNNSGKETNILSLTLRGVVNNDPDNPEGLVPSDYSTYQIFEKNDLVFKLIDLENLRTSRVGLVHERGIMSPAYIRLTLIDKNLSIKYFFKQFYDLYLRAIYNYLGEGVRSTLAPTDLLNISILLPPPEEQRLIARYLDWADARIARLIAARERQVALLEEYKQALIHQAVTGQIDVRTGKPYAEYKDSGVAWLGKVPKHWEVNRFKRIAKVSGKLVDPRLEEYCTKILISPNHIERGGTGRLLKLETADGQGADSSKYEVKAGEIIYCKIRPYLRKAIIAPIDCLCSADMYPITIKNRNRLTSRFLLFEMLSQPFTQYAIDSSLRAAMPKINREALGEAPVWLPPISEQFAIVDHIEGEIATVNTVIDGIRQSIDLLKEYRTRLVADVVTGKVDVREIARRLEEEMPAVKDSFNPTDQVKITSEKF